MTCAEKMLSGTSSFVRFVEPLISVGSSGLRRYDMGEPARRGWEAQYVDDMGPTPTIVL